MRVGCLIKWMGLRSPNKVENSICVDQVFERQSMSSKIKKGLKSTKGCPLDSLCDMIKVAVTYSPTFYCSTIGAIGLNFSVRDGKRWTPML